MQIKITFVCTGNTCRSPFAAELFKKTHPQYDITSVGIWANEGDPASENMIEAAKDYGIDLSSHKAKRMTAQTVYDTDLFVFMNRDDWYFTEAVAGDGRAYLLGGGICDPFGGPLSFYKSCAKEIEKGLDELDKFLKTNAVVRFMDKDDVEAVAEIEKECFSRPWSEKALLDEINNEDQARFFVAESGGEIVGYIGTLSVARECSVTNIAVKEKYRHLGIGTKLMARAIYTSREKGDEFITLEVRKSNENALKLYENFRFKIEGERKNFYRDPVEDAYILMRNFEEEIAKGVEIYDYDFKDLKGYSEL